LPNAAFIINFYNLFRPSLIAQAQAEGLAIVTADQAISQYGIKVISALH